MKHRLFGYVGSALIGLAVLPMAAMAQSASAYTNAPSEIYAGPDGSYPAVARVDGGVPVSVMGCVSGYAWCDVALPGLRGWIYGGSLNYDYGGNPVPLLEYGPRLGLPIIGFSVGNYWDNFYRGQPWYHDRDRWEHRGPPRGYGGPGPGRPDYGQRWEGGGPPGNFRGDQRFDHGGGDHRGPGGGENRGPGPGGPGGGDHRGPGPGGGENRGPAPGGGPGGGDHRGPGPGGGQGGDHHGPGPGGGDNHGGPGVPGNHP